MTSKKSRKMEIPQVANDHKDSHTIEEKKNTDENDGLIKASESMTEKSDGNTRSGKSQTKIKWSITTERETKTTAQKAADKADLGLWEWIDKTLREVGISELTFKPQPPARPEDMVKTIVEQFAEKFKADQAPNVQAQNDIIKEQGNQIAALTNTIQQQGKHIEALTQALANQTPPSIKDLIFGKSKKD